MLKELPRACRGWKELLLHPSVCHLLSGAQLSEPGTGTEGNAKIASRAAAKLQCNTH